MRRTIGYFDLIPVFFVFLVLAVSCGFAENAKQNHRSAKSTNAHGDVTNKSIERDDGEKKSNVFVVSTGEWKQIPSPLDGLKRPQDLRFFPHNEIMVLFDKDKSWIGTFAIAKLDYDITWIDVKTVAPTFKDCQGDLMFGSGKLVGMPSWNSNKNVECDGFVYDSSAKSLAKLPVATFPFGGESIDFNGVVSADDLVIWGGAKHSSTPPYSPRHALGARFQFSKNTWVTIPANGAPSARWGGILLINSLGRLVVAGGSDADLMASEGGAIFDIATGGGWQALSSKNFPSGQLTEGLQIGKKSFLFGDAQKNGKYNRIGTPVIASLDDASNVVSPITMPFSSQFFYFRTQYHIENSLIIIGSPDEGAFGCDGREFSTFRYDISPQKWSKLPSLVVTPATGLCLLVKSFPSNSKMYHVVMKDNGVYGLMVLEN